MSKEGSLLRAGRDLGFDGVIPGLLLSPGTCRAPNGCHRVLTGLSGIAEGWGVLEKVRAGKG